MQHSRDNVSCHRSASHVQRDHVPGFHQQPLAGVECLERTDLAHTSQSIAQTRPVEFPLLRRHRALT